MVRKSLLIEISHCLQLVSIGSLLTTWVCFDPEPAWEGGFPEIMTPSLRRSLLSRTKASVLTSAGHPVGRRG